MTTLGQAYVQIMPSAKGISGSIQKTINPEATAAGKSAGRNIASSMASSMSSAGKTLTKAITVPAMAAATAVGGIVAAFGWKRLVAVDAAQAQLKGLGYSAEDVSRISDGLRDAITGGMLTMAEATSAAATAMAAGIQEGDELTRYIQLLDSAVVGGTGTFMEMEQIFGRIVDQGKLTRTEFDMIAQRMPGFSAAVQDHMGIGSEAMYEMLRNGEISTNDFLDVMEGFAGGMADAYANSWSGMVQNTIANIGIIGEHILGGVFEQSKESIAEFLEYLRSDDVKAWAEETGQAIGEVFQSLIEKVQNAIEWWTGLDQSTKNLLMTLAGIVVAIGPILLIISKLITVVITIHKWFGMLKVAAGIVGAAIGAISAPVLIAIAAIAAIIAIGVALYKNWDTVKAKASQLGSWIANIFSNMRNAISNAWSSIRSATSSAWSGILSTISNITSSIRSNVSNVFNSLRGVVSSAFNGVRSAVSSGITSALNVITNMAGNFLNAGRNIVTSIADGIKGAIGSITGAIGNVASKIRNFLPFSPAKEGPLKDLDKLDFGGTISLGIDDGADEVHKAMEEMLTLDVSKKSNFHNPNFNNGDNPYVAQQNQPIILQVDGKTFAQIIGDYTSQEGGNRIRRIERGLST